MQLKGIKALEKVGKIIPEGELYHTSAPVGGGVERLLADIRRARWILGGLAIVEKNQDKNYLYLKQDQ